MKKKMILSLLFFPLLLGGFVGCNNGELVEPDSDKKNDNLLFQEIFYIGSLQPKKDFFQGGLFNLDQYIKIVNPTEKTLYLDSLVLMVCGLANTQPHDLAFGTDHRDSCFAASIVLQFPGKGQDYPIQPGKSVLLTANAVNYTSQYDKDGNERFDWCQNSFDLSSANFEWCTPEQNDDGDYGDNHNVPNLINIFGDPSSPQLISGAQVIALAKLGVNSSELKNNPKYDWSTTWADLSKGDVDIEEGEKITYIKIPNSWIIDAVSLCPTNGYMWNTVGVNVDKSSIGVIDNISQTTQNAQEIAGLAVYRKYDGKKYVDSNNSAFDFEVKKASMYPATTPSKPEDKNP